MKRLLALGALAIGACGGETLTFEPSLIDSPSQIAFACYGPVKGGTDTPSAQPLSACAEQLVSTEAGKGPSFYSLVLETAPGRLAVISQAVSKQVSDNNTVFSVVGQAQDSDSFTPNKNAIPVATLPVDVETDPSGCFVFTANAGSCDLSRLQVGSVVDTGSAGGVDRVQIKNGAAERNRISARPRSMLFVPPATPPEPVMCPATPAATDTFYVTLPSCHAVVGVDASTGTIVAAIRFDATGTPTVVADVANFTCPIECPDGMAADGGAITAGARPVTMDLKMVGGEGQLMVAHDNVPQVSRFALGADGRTPVAQPTITLEGPSTLGVTRIRMTDGVDIGQGLGLPRRFAYAIATDRTIRVMEVLDGNSECNTQVDPRALTSETLPGNLACLPLARPRRAGARSPGIQLPDDIIPLDLAFYKRAAPTAQSATMLGDFAYITASDARIYIVTIDDDLYADVPNPGDPLTSIIPLAISHQLRDGGSGREALATDCASPAESAATLGPRLSTAPAQDPATLEELRSKVAEAAEPLLPRVGNVLCALDDEVPVPEMSFAAPVAVRNSAFRDLLAVLTGFSGSAGRVAERWVFTFEGELTAGFSRGYFDTSDGALSLIDSSQHLCSTGALPLDFVNLLGCNPQFGNGDCGVGETCSVHPNSPATVRTGTCLPAGQEEALVQTCRRFAATLRQYSITAVQNGRATLVPRKRILRTEPVAGCVDAMECDRYWQEERGIRLGEHPAKRTAVGSSEFVPKWTCEADSGHSAGNHCVMTCAADTECEAGYVCEGNRCVAGIVPPPECISALQAYTINGGESLIVRGSFSGYLHNRGATGDTCVELSDPNQGFHPRKRRPDSAARHDRRLPGFDGDAARSGAGAVQRHRVPSGRAA